MKAANDTRSRKYWKLSLGLAVLVLVCLALVPAPVTPKRATTTTAKSAARGAWPRIPDQGRRPLRASGGFASQTHSLKSYGQLPLSFEANRGQTDSQVKFLSRGRGYTVFLTSTEAVLALKKPEARSQKSQARRQLPFVSGQLQKAARLRPALVAPSLSGAYSGSAGGTVVPTDNGQRTAGAVLRMELVGANPSPRVRPLAQLPGKSNYLIGNDPKKWRTNVPNYAEVEYRDIYSGVDLVYYGNQGQLEYDFVVAPGADPSQIALDVGARLVPAQGRPEGAPLHYDRNGDLLVGTPGGEVVFHKPVVYQRTTDNGQRKAVDGRYVLKGDREVTFEVASYDRSKPLVIDPVLKYSTYLGGSGDDLGSPSGVQGIAVDPEGNAYIIGATDSTDFPATPGVFQTKLAGGSGVFGCFNGIPADAFVTKLNKSGDAIVYSTYLGGSDDDCGEGIAVDPSGNAYVAGETLSNDFPITKGAFQPACASCSGGTVDTFAAKLSRDGSTLIYSTYIGGDNADLFPMVALDRFGNLYIQGSTFSTDYPTTQGAFQTACLACPTGGVDTYVTKVNPTGTALVYSTYLGGSVFDICGAEIAVDSGGDAYVNGFTCSPDFPTHNSLQAYAGGCDGFLTKLNPTGSAPVYSTYLGGSNFDSINGTAIDSTGNAYVSGQTFSSDLPTTPGAFQTNFVGGNNCPFPPCGDAFAAKINAAGTALVYATYLGGTGDDVGFGMAVDHHGNAYVAGFTTSTDFPTLNAFQRANAGGYDIFVTELNPAGRALIYSTYLGGSGDEMIGGIAFDPQRLNLYVEGHTTSSDFPAVNAAQPQFGGGTFDAIVAKIGPGNPPAPGPGLSRPNKANSNPGTERPGPNRAAPIVNWKMDMARKAAR